MITFRNGVVYVADEIIGWETINMIPDESIIEWYSTIDRFTVCKTNCALPTSKAHVLEKSFDNALKEIRASTEDIRKNWANRSFFDRTHESMWTEYKNFCQNMFAGIGWQMFETDRDLRRLTQIVGPTMAYGFYGACLKVNPGRSSECIPGVEDIRECYDNVKKRMELRRICNGK